MNDPQDRNGEHPFGDAGQVILFIVFMILWAVDSFFLRFSTQLAAVLPLAIRLAVLVLALGTAIGLVRSGHTVIDHHRPSPCLVITGAFRYVRHPLYLGVMLTYFGLAVASGSLWALALLVLVFLFYDFIATYEESLLAVRFGPEYTEYRRRTGKWLPGVAKWKNPR
jgi:protein-S-isoprenylcysteine O-methyltransferase Ste14